MRKILILDDNLTICLMLKSWLVKQSYRANFATTVEEAKQKVRDEAYDLILLDIRLPESDGFSFLSWVKKFDSDILVIMMTGYADIETAVESMKAGAVDYIAKPIEAEWLYKKIADAFRNQENQKKLDKHREHFVLPKGQVYDAIRAKLSEVIQNDSHLLLIGNHGTGKTSAAKYIYFRSGIELRPFVSIQFDSNEGVSPSGYENCTHWLSDSLERARGGMLLIKDFQKTDISVQTLLLKALRTQKKNENYTQIIMTSTKSKEHLGAGLLPKLFETLRRSYVELPPLKGNCEAILFYAEHFLELANHELNKDIKKIEREVFEQFFNHSWNDNIQELKNMIFKACLLAEGNSIKKSMLPLLFKKTMEEKTIQDEPPKYVIERLKKENFEKERILEALEIAKGNKTVAASLLNIDRKTLYNKIKLYNVEVN